ncbi:MAG: hypothetical protein ABR501_12440, partial [Pyrinomonadaceae bacterium]
ADVEIRDDKAADLLALIKESLRERRFGLAVRMEVSSTMPLEMVEYLTQSIGLEPDDVYEINGVLSASDLMELYSLERPDLKDPPLKMTVPSPLRKKKSVFVYVGQRLYSYSRARPEGVGHQDMSLPHRPGFSHPGGFNRGQRAW